MIVDTAGRLQNKSNLMDELAKMKRVFPAKSRSPARDLSYHRCDDGPKWRRASQGLQEFTDFTGIVITKMDGTIKGGIILSIRDEIGVPVRFIGLGEKMDDLEEFDLDEYLHALSSGEKEA
jgi:fused signal recognition particle receptor